MAHSFSGQSADTQSIDESLNQDLPISSELQAGMARALRQGKGWHSAPKKETRKNAVLVHRAQRDVLPVNRSRRGLACNVH